MDTKKYAADKFDAGFEEVKSNIIKFNKPGDVIRGTLVEVTDFVGDYGPNKNYHIIADAGFFHGGTKDAVDETPTELVKGQRYSFLGHMTVNDALQQAETGQVIVVRFVELKESKKRKGAKYKSMVAKLGAMDPDFAAKPSKDDIPFE